MKMFKDEVCDHCGVPEWSGFQCCDDCSERLFLEFEAEDES